MTPKTEILGELEHLITLGSSLAVSQDEGIGALGVVRPERDFRVFVIGAVACIRRVAGENSDYFRMLELPEPGMFIAGNEIAIASLIGSLQALHRAVSFDWLESLESRLRANVHEDFLLQAKVLLEASYYVAGMVLIGGVLEDHLRKLCDNRGLTCKGKGSLGQYNDLLRDVYPQPAWRHVQAIADLRNCAAHGDGAKITAEQVELAHTFVSQMIVNYPA